MKTAAKSMLVQTPTGYTGWLLLWLAYRQSPRQKNYLWLWWLGFMARASSGYKQAVKTSFRISKANTDFVTDLFSLLQNRTILICLYTHTHFRLLVLDQDSPHSNIFPNTSYLTQMQFPVKQNLIANHSGIHRQQIYSLSFMQHLFYYSEKQSLDLVVSEKFFLA